MDAIELFVRCEMHIADRRVSFFALSVRRAQHQAYVNLLNSHKC